MRYYIDIPSVTIGSKTKRLPPSLNDRLHHMARYGWFKAFKEATYYAVKELKIPPMEKISVTVENRTIRAMDVDNLSASTKPLLDGLVLAGVIPDDSPKYLPTLKVESIKVAKKNLQRLTVIIEEI